MKKLMMIAVAALAIVGCSVTKVTYEKNDRRHQGVAV